MDDQITHELTLSFAAKTTALAAALKREVLAWFAAQGVSAIVEGVIDGVDTLVGDTALAEAAFGDEGSDATPVSVFEFDHVRLSELASSLAVRFAGRGLKQRMVQLSTRSWAQAWQPDFEGVQTPTFSVSLSGHEAPAKTSGKIAIELAPGQAFGAGDHATTQVCLLALEGLKSSGHLTLGGRCLDVGTGTGILAIAAAKLGMGFVLGTDIDSEVLAEAAANAALNGVTMDLACTAEPPVSAPFELIVANILVPVLHQLMPRFATSLANQGVLLLAGFIDKDVDALVATAAAHGLKPFASQSVRGWVALAFKAP